MLKTNDSYRRHPMKLWLIIPVKPFCEGKSRLSVVLPQSKRAQLSRQLFHHVIAQAIDATVLAGILVVSRDPSVLEGLYAPNLHLLLEEGCDLNQAVHQGRTEAIRRGADAILVLPADLPRLRTADITALYEQGSADESIVIVPSTDNGTNALFVRPPQAINFAFGQNSFQHHCFAAQFAHLPCVIFDAPHLSFDVDLPPDLAALTSEPAFQPYKNHTSPFLEL